MAAVVTRRPTGAAVQGKQGQVAVLDLNMSMATTTSNPTSRTIIVGGIVADFNPTLRASFN